MFHKKFVRKIILFLASSDANFIFTSFIIYMIYSKRLQQYIPVQITSESYDLKEFGRFTKYSVKDGKMPVGYIDLLDTPKGVEVQYITNQYPQFYSNFGNLADQIEVEHCLKRGMDTFEIRSDAALNSHAKHYLRGKRFLIEKYNEIVQKIIESTPKGEHFNTKSLGRIKMYMPKEMIDKILCNIKKHPLL